VFGFTVDTVVVQPGHDPGLLSQVLVSTSMTDEVQPPVENFALQPIRGTASRGTRCVEEQGREIEVAIHVHRVREEVDDDVCCRTDSRQVALVAMLVCVGRRGRREN
jgi:hypothetical protein